MSCPKLVKGWKTPAVTSTIPAQVEENERFVIVVQEPRVFYPPSQNTTAVKPWMNAKGGPSEARRAK